MKRLVRSYRFSPVAGAVILVTAAAILVLAIGPEHDEVPAFVVIFAVLTVVCIRRIGG